MASPRIAHPGLTCHCRVLCSVPLGGGLPFDAQDRWPRREGAGGGHRRRRPPRRRVVGGRRCASRGPRRSGPAAARGGAAFPGARRGLTRSSRSRRPRIVLGLTAVGVLAAQTRVRCRDAQLRTDATHPAAFGRCDGQPMTFRGCGSRQYAGRRPRAGEPPRHPDGERSRSHRPQTCGHPRLSSNTQRPRAWSAPSQVTRSHTEFASWLRRYCGA